MDVVTFIETLDGILDGKLTAEAARPSIEAFVGGDIVRDHVRHSAELVLSRLKAGESPFSAQEGANPAILYGAQARDGSRRDLILRTSGNAPAFHSVSPESYVLVPIDPIDVDVFAIRGADGASLYGRPTRDARLEITGLLRAGRGEAIVRRDPMVVLDVRYRESLKYLIYIRSEEVQSYKLIFDRDTLGCVGTSMSDVSSTKAIAFLEILEYLGAPSVADAAYRFTRHYAPVVRWRALSSLNKVGDSRTTEVLESFLDDRVASIREGAQRILAAGKA